MFNDLITDNLISMSQVKASPSVNSPNDGDFNSEENARWATKKLTTKPFVVGQTEEEVANNTFGNDMTIAGYSFYTGSALFSIDGYLFKLAAPGETSYDYPQTSGSGVGVDCAHVQNFVAGLTNYGTSDELQTEYSQFMFSNYNPTNGVTSELKQAWEDACDNETVLGYIKNVYKNTYFEALTLSPSGNTVTYGKTTIECSLVSDPSGPDFFQGETEPLAKVRYDSGSADPTGVDIYYPIRLKKVRYYDETNKQYKLDYRLYFTDIFSLEHVFSVITSSTRLYPNTENIWANMGDNVPLVEIGFTDCDLTTYDGNIYDYVSTMYTAGSPYQRKSLDTQVSTSTSQFNIESLYDVYYIDNPDSTKNLMQYMPQIVDVDKIPSIRNKVKYYCFKSSEHNMFTELALSVYENGPKVPVAFMTSDGKLCPDGFYWGNNGSGINTTYPVEGYLHFIKRVYISIQSPAATEEDINNVTIQDLINWTESHNFGNGISMNFADFYNILYKHICIYMQVGYSSLMKKAVLTNDVSSESFKAFACGNALANISSSSIVRDEFLTYQSYNYNGYTNNNGTLEPDSFQYYIPHNRDYTSDSRKFRIGTLSPVSTNIFESYNYNPVISDTDISDIVILFEDPINLIKRCTDENTATGFPIDSVYAYNNSSITSIPVYNNTRKLILDEFLAPVIQNKPGNDAVPTNNLCSYYVTNTTIGPGAKICSSFVNGLQYQVRKNSWVVYIPFAASTRKDSLNYLSGKNYVDGKYNGLNFRFVLDNDFNQDDLVLFKYKGQSIPSVTSYGIETFNNGYNIKDTDIKTAREAFLHVSKVYDGDRELGMIIDDVENNIESISNTVSSIDSRVSDVETSINGDSEHDGLETRVTSLENTVNTPDTGLADRVSNTEQALSNACMILETGLLSDPESLDSRVTYTIYGKSLTHGNNVCIINGYGLIAQYDTPWDEPLHEETGLHLSPLINKNIYSVIIQPGITSVGSAAFCFDFNDLTIPSTVEVLGLNLVRSTQDHVTGPKYITIQEGARSLLGVFYLTNTRLVSINLPQTITYQPSYSFTLADNVYLTSCTVQCHLITSAAGLKSFANCTSLKYLTLSNTYKIGTHSFIGCSSLKTLNYLGTKSMWSDVIKEADWDVTGLEGSAVTSRLETIRCYDGNLVYDDNTGTWVDET